MVVNVGVRLAVFPLTVFMQKMAKPAGVSPQPRPRRPPPLPGIGPPAPAAAPAAPHPWCATQGRRLTWARPAVPGCVQELRKRSQRIMDLNKALSATVGTSSSAHGRLGALPCQQPSCPAGRRPGGRRPGGSTGIRTALPCHAFLSSQPQLPPQRSARR